MSPEEKFGKTANLGTSHKFQNVFPKPSKYCPEFKSDIFVLSETPGKTRTFDFVGSQIVQNLTL